jgi:hypothetical protein
LGTLLRRPGVIQNQDGVADHFIRFQFHLIALDMKSDISHTHPSSQDNGMVKCWGSKGDGVLGIGLPYDENDVAVGDDKGGILFFVSRIESLELGLL